MISMAMERVEFFHSDGLKSYAVTRQDQARLVAGRVEHVQRSAANELPSARRIQRIDARLSPRNPNTPGGDQCTRGCPSGSCDAFIHLTEIGKPWKKADHIGVIGH